jgi:cullin-associated NEDD8-dissociated protein 1
MVHLASSPAATVRAVVITALRHALTQQQQHALASASHLTSHQHTHAPSLDGRLLSSHIPSFLKLLRDSDLSVRRQAILTVSALAHAREGQSLLAGSFKDVILPTLYAHLKQDATLVRVVNLGPFSHKIDDG